MEKGKNHNRLPDFLMVSGIYMGERRNAKPVCIDHVSSEFSIFTKMFRFAKKIMAALFHGR